MCESAFCVTFSVKVLFLFVVCLGKEEEFPTSQQSVCRSSFSSFRHGKSATTTTALRGIVDWSLLIQDITPPSTQRISNIITDNQGFKK